MAVTSRARGFTLIELLIVVALIAIASGLASLALRDPSTARLEQEGARLTALLESARAEARASGLAVHWDPKGDAASGRDFGFVGLPDTVEMPKKWLNEGVTADVIGARAVLLGPEPLIGAQRIVLSLEDRRLTLATDGLGPFEVVSE
jgi:general secretion pathway protein H